RRGHTSFYLGAGGLRGEGSATLSTVIRRGTWTAPRRDGISYPAVSIAVTIAVALATAVNFSAQAFSLSGVIIARPPGNGWVSAGARPSFRQLKNVAWLMSQARQNSAMVLLGRSEAGELRAGRRLRRASLRRVIA